jgi:PIN domain nuclease of toxin-antitoxin system
VIVLDTHALLWWASEPRRLSRRAAAEIARAERVGLPTIVFWEIALLVRKGRIELGAPAASWLERILQIPRCEALPLSAIVALQADGLDMHADPADRFIAATALHLGAPIVSKDRLLADVKGLRVIW